MLQSSNAKIVLPESQQSLSSCEKCGECHTHSPVDTGYEYVGVSDNVRFYLLRFIPSLSIVGPILLSYDVEPLASLLRAITHGSVTLSLARNWSECVSNGYYISQRRLKCHCGMRRKNIFQVINATLTMVGDISLYDVALGVSLKGVASTTDKININLGVNTVMNINSYVLKLAVWPFCTLIAWSTLVSTL